ncbi:MAG TPA: shikimate kinase [bacterium]|uniref:Shikimate kinase n=1 Tax=candidate division TA06 bacterium ADurb.Bin417 TaxID=1852828 RepID=A0A1V5M7V3_UNCT6|nr:MAG: Shikimate kinase [candidate division TA06 bacterium ADurb.Bin417]HNS49383.1 shikimate kinase [bacterium]
MKIVLTGFMGTGKTAVGKILARRLGYRFLDTDDLIEARAGRPISEIFNRDGETAFRLLESEVIASLAEADRTVIATGGGAVLDPENMTNLGSNGLIFALLADPAEIARRTASQRHRPLLNVPDRETRIREMLKKRLPYYQRAGQCLETTGRTPEAIAGEIIRILETDKPQKEPRP